MGLDSEKRRSSVYADIEKRRLSAYADILLMGVTHLQAFDVIVQSDHAQCEE